ncbi:MAG: sodium:solute symporter family protein [Candidatus Krumholzibacteriia bacterium]
MVLLVVYVLFLCYAILRLFWRQSKASADYIVLGRRLTLPAFVMTLVATWYGGILGVGEYAWRYGASNWLVFGVPYYLNAVVFALFLAARARRSSSLTIPDQLAARYGRPTALAGAAMVFVMTAPAAYILMLGSLVHLATGWPLALGVTLGAFFSVAYVFRGGMRAIVGTDIVHFCLMFLAFLIMVPVCVAKYGGWDFLRANLPAAHLTWDGGRGAQAVLVWYFIALATLVEPTFYLRCYAARDERTARRGVLISIAFWVLFDFLTTTAGLYARAVLPDLADPVSAYPALAACTLAPIWQGLFMIGLLATIISTVDDYAFLSAVTLGRDIILRLRAPRGPGADAAVFLASDAAESAAIPLIRWSLLGSSLLAIGMALWSGSVIGLWHHLGSIGTPVLLAPLALSHTSLRIPGRTALRAMLLAGAAALAWLALGRGGPYLGVEAIFPGLAVSLAAVGPAVWRAWTDRRRCAAFQHR